MHSPQELRSREIDKRHIIQINHDRLAPSGMLDGTPGFLCLLYPWPRQLALQLEGDGLSLVDACDPQHPSLPASDGKCTSLAKPLFQDCARVEVPSIAALNL